MQTGKVLVAYISAEDAVLSAAESLIRLNLLEPKDA